MQRESHVVHAHDSPYLYTPVWDKDTTAVTNPMTRETGFEE
jgi:hypothetical protein